MNAKPLTIEVRNSRNVVVGTFGDQGLAFKFCRERSDLGSLFVWTVETIVRERKLDEPLVIPIRGAAGLRASRGGR